MSVTYIQGYPQVLKEQWEPVAVSLVNTEYLLVNYVTALLQHFGPQQAKIDVSWRIMTSTLPTDNNWPNDAVALMNMLPQLSADFAVYGGAIFLTSDARHRKALSEYTQTVPI
ncbi:hypothetical protein AB6A40_006552 [Gnathostoma spinigerum]|uniref:Uncharacterized protein n=1 Tax=Gnathostoma spinigerum TaxID=75299 RepID=A0ABD6ES49_9BILA